MRNLLSDGGQVDRSDFLSRADVLATTGHTVMISDFAGYYRLAAYLFDYTNRRIGLAMGAMNLCELFDEAYYSNRDGGILEPRTQHLVTIDKLEVPPALRQLYGYLIDRRCIVQLTDVDHAYLNSHLHEVLRKIRGDSGEWEAMVPPNVAAAIKERKLFGYA